MTLLADVGTESVAENHLDGGLDCGDEASERGGAANDAEAAGSTVSAGGSLGFVLYERTERTRSLYEAVGRGRVDRAALVCGAEGGISPAELERLCDAGFVPLHFKTNILRCETAALYGIAALQSALAEGDIWQCKE